MYSSILFWYLMHRRLHKSGGLVRKNEKQMRLIILPHDDMKTSQIPMIKNNVFIEFQNEYLAEKIFERRWWQNGHKYISCTKRIDFVPKNKVRNANLIPKANSEHLSTPGPVF